jgi:hypothetical protein
MRITLIAVGASLAMLVVGAPSASAKPDGVASHGSSDAAKLCAAQKKADSAAFKALWGKHAMRDCIRAGRAEDEVATATPEQIKNAAQTCRDERALDPAAFAATYGTNDNDRNAFGQCVSTKVQEEEPEPTV